MQAVIQHLKQLIGFASISSESNIPLIEYVETQLAAHGAIMQRIPHPNLPKTNLLASIGPMVEGGVVLSGHTDVVPVAGQQWKTDPFTLSEVGGRYIGRGTADMKTFIAIILAMLPQMQQLQRPIHIALSYDEEVGCLGAPTLIDAIKKLPKPQAVIVGEPSGMQIVDAHKAAITVETSISGLAAHASQPQLGFNAITLAHQLIDWLMQQADTFKKTTDNRFTPAYSTLQVGTIRGGNASNIIPADCQFTWDCRCLPEQAPQDILNAYIDYCDQVALPAARQVFADISITTRMLSCVPGLKPKSGCAAKALTQSISGQADTCRVAYATEAGQFQAAGFDTVICGPGHIAQAHQANEFISHEQCELGYGFIQALIHKLSH